MNIFENFMGKSKEAVKTAAEKVPGKEIVVAGVTLFMAETAMGAAPETTANDAEQATIETAAAVTSEEINPETDFVFGQDSLEGSERADEVMNHNCFELKNLGFESLGGEIVLKDNTGAILEGESIVDLTTRLDARTDLKWEGGTDGVSVAYKGKGAAPTKLVSKMIGGKLVLAVNEEASPVMDNMQQETGPAIGDDIAEVEE